MPTTIRIKPTVWMFTPETVAVTAQVRIAPTAIRIDADSESHVFLLGSCEQ